MSHYKLNPPPYVPGPNKFIGVPDSSFGAILTDEQQQADNVIRAFGAQGANQQAYVEDFYNGTADSPPAPTSLQLADIGDHFTLGPVAKAAVGHGTAATRAEFLTGLKIANGYNAENGPIREQFRVGAGQSTTVNCATVGSVYAARCDSFQRGLNAGGHGPK